MAPGLSGPATPSFYTGAASQTSVACLAPKLFVSLKPLVWGQSIWRVSPQDLR